jgi:glycosyltransferase involved in cell wall biosynthesis
MHGSNVMAALFLESLQKLGYRVKMIQKTFSKKVEEVEKFSLGKLAKIPFLGLKVVRQLFKEKPDICFYFITVSLAGFLLDTLYISLLRLFNVPYVLYCHGKGFKALEKSYGFMRLILTNILGNAKGALVLGERLKEDLSPYLDPARMFVLPNAIPDNTTGHKPPDFRDKAKIQVLFLSNLIPSKGVLEFLQMANLVAVRAPNVHFILAGPKFSENFYQILLDFIQREGLENIVELPGGLYGEKKNQAFRESDIFVFPTYYEFETFGLVNLEAMQWSLPIISSNEGSIPEVVVDGKNGFIVNPKDIPQLVDRVLRLLNDRELRLRMGLEGRKMFSKYFTIDQYQKNLANAIKFFQNITF